MANNYYDATGVLVLHQVTPVIRALFGGFNLDETIPGDGMVYIASQSEECEPTWDDIRDKLEALAATFSPVESEMPIRELLYHLAQHFNVREDSALLKLIDECDFDNYADLATLFALALRFDDRHGLSAMKIEGCWHSSKPRLFEFGGDGLYEGREYSYSVQSSEALELGATIDQAIQTGNLDAATDRLMQKIDHLLSGVTQPELANRLRGRLCARLADVPCGEASLMWYAVTGRIPGDDEDTCHLFHVSSRQEALDAFEAAMWEEEIDEVSERQAARERTFKEHGQHVFVNTVVCCATPITDLS